MAKIMPGEFEQWATQHISLFRLAKQEDQSMVQMWHPIFASYGYTLAELLYATQALAVNPPKYPTEHLKHIHAIIGAFRKRMVEEEQSTWSAIEEFEACKNCQNTGWAVVPNLRYLSNGEWNCYSGTGTKPVHVVTCSCNIGKRVASTHSGYKRPMGLEQYEERNPDWRAQVAEYAEAKRAEHKVAQAIESRTKSPAKMVEELAAHMAHKPARREVSEEYAEAARRSRLTGQKQLRLYESDTDGGLRS